MRRAAGQHRGSRRADAGSVWLTGVLHRIVDEHAPPLESLNQSEALVLRCRRRIIERLDPADDGEDAQQSVPGSKVALAASQIGELESVQQPRVRDDAAELPNPHGEVQPALGRDALGPKEVHRDVTRVCQSMPSAACHWQRNGATDRRRA